jgi:hypothetical protein
VIHRLGSLAGWNDLRGGANLSGDPHGLLYLAEFVAADVSKETLALDEAKQRVPGEVSLRLIEPERLAPRRFPPRRDKR